MGKQAEVENCKTTALLAYFVVKRETEGRNPRYEN